MGPSTALTHAPTLVHATPATLRPAPHAQPCQLAERSQDPRRAGLRLEHINLGSSSEAPAHRPVIG